MKRTAFNGRQAIFPVRRVIIKLLAAKGWSVIVVRKAAGTWDV